uniref:Uncharacterized protein n=1 Tax=Nelumbo nucifera TaxID=4432 RepID=A0A822XJB1_NELNU|nr:TPA_asm: hypothetical protein HUJ06_020539 [Nelumbo nucifera]
MEFLLPSQAKSKFGVAIATIIHRSGPNEETMVGEGIGITFVRDGELEGVIVPFVQPALGSSRFSPPKTVMPVVNLSRMRVMEFQALLEFHLGITSVLRDEGGEVGRGIDFWSFYCHCHTPFGFFSLCLLVHYCHCWPEVAEVTITDNGVPPTQWISF